MSHPLSIALALVITFVAVGDALAARRVNFCLVKSCEAQRDRTHTKKVARKPRATRARAVAKVTPAPETAPATVAATTNLVPQPQPPPEAEQATALLAPIPVPRPIRPPLAEPNAAAQATAAAVLPPAAAVMSNSAMPDRQKFFERRESYRKLAKAEALRQCVPFPLVDAVMKVESGYDPSALGAAGEIGLMQLIPETAALLGFQGTAVELAEPAVNITLGTTYLARAWSLAKQDVCTAVMKYRAGHGESRFSQLSVTYCERVRAHLLVSGFPVTGSLPKVDLVPAPSVSATGADRSIHPKLMVPEFSELAPDRFVSPNRSAASRPGKIPRRHHRGKTSRLMAAESSAWETADGITVLVDLQDAAYRTKICSIAVEAARERLICMPRLDATPRASDDAGAFGDAGDEVLGAAQN